MASRSGDGDEPSTSCAHKSFSISTSDKSSPSGISTTATSGILSQEAPLQCLQTDEHFNSAFLQLHAFLQPFMQPQEIIRKRCCGAASLAGHHFGVEALWRGYPPPGERVQCDSQPRLYLRKTRIQYTVLSAIDSKSFILNVKGHGGYSSCTKCTARGRYNGNRVCYPETDAVERKDEDVLSKVDTEFYNHETNSLLEEIPNLGFVSNVPLDYMHLVCLGVVRKNSKFVDKR
ncbi:unnamed protein product [Larinioides sclopetarius]|uniref:Uncharacterized protein n=1 Tax=Larinioides sclopetarius TaxID=280406 RepID=A0AAV2B0K6_9ARAC